MNGHQPVVDRLIAALADTEAKKTVRCDACVVGRLYVRMLALSLDTGDVSPGF